MLVSVLLPVFNAERTLGIALESVRRQRRVELECVAVDDGSSDGSLACLRRAARADARFRVLAGAHRITWLQWLLVAVGVTYSVIAWRCWFRIPLLGALTGTVLMAAGWVLQAALP